MSKIVALVLAFWTGGVALVQAQSPVVVELFTSQGCSSCPPADRLLHDLASRDDVIALALHVDYWDYIGWKDEFADPAYAKRQRGYAIEAGRKSVYTPQMIVNGTTDIVGTRPMDLSDAIAAHKAKPSPVSLKVSREGASQIRIQAQGNAKGPLVVHMVRYQPERIAKITRGENAGHTLRYANVTEQWNVLTEWDAKAPLDIAAKADGRIPLVVIIQRGKHGPIVAAAKLR